MGGAGAARRRPAMELPQVPGRPRWANHRLVFHADRADRSAHDRGDRERAEIARRFSARISSDNRSDWPPPQYWVCFPIRATPQSPEFRLRKGETMSVILIFAIFVVVGDAL